MRMLFLTMENDRSCLSWGGQQVNLKFRINLDFPCHTWRFISGSILDKGKFVGDPVIDREKFIGGFVPDRGKFVDDSISDRKIYKRPNH